MWASSHVSCVARGAFSQTLSARLPWDIVARGRSCFSTLSSARWLDRLDRLDRARAASLVAVPPLARVGWTRWHIGAIPHHAARHAHSARWFSGWGHGGHQSGAGAGAGAGAEHEGQTTDTSLETLHPLLRDRLMELGLSE